MCVVYASEYEVEVHQLAHSHAAPQGCSHDSEVIFSVGNARYFFFPGKLLLLFFTARFST